MEEKKAEDILLLDLTGITPFTDFFVICSGTSHRMLRALMNAAQDEVKAKYQLGSRPEGKPEDGWLLVDYGDIVLHIFSMDQRENFRLEDLWTEGKVLLHVQ